MSRAPKYFPDLNQFRATIARGFEIIPVHRQLLGDHLTPVTAFEVLGRDAHAFLLESVVGGEEIGRYSFIATSPRLVYSATQSTTSDPLADLAKLLPTGKYARDRNLPAFTGGLVGYAGYDTARYYEPEKLAKSPPDDRHLPDVLFALYDDLVIFDHVDKTIKVVANARDGTDQSYANACRRIDEIVQRLSQPTITTLGEIDTASDVTILFTSNMTRETFERAVRTGLEYIRAGDIFQFVPSQRLRVVSDAAPFDVYRALRVINPSPFMFYLKSPACTLIGSSPEILCRVQDRKITTRPLAGTRRRGASDVEDAAIERELLADPKERAEHIMLVDLHRNDISRVSKPGSVKIDEMMRIERYSHVMHISSTVTGELCDDMSALDALRVSLPVGTVSGAPKIRAMQVIDEVEPTRRGPYGGAVGYLDLTGNMDTCIALRTIVWKNGVFDVQAGAGIVADSNPASEYEETLSKARAMLKAIEVAQRGL